jgi:hypothetical protein
MRGSRCRLQVAAAASMVNNTWCTSVVVLDACTLQAEHEPLRHQINNAHLLHQGGE